MDDIKEVTKGFFSSKTITQLIVLIIVIIIAGVYLFSEIQDNKQNNKTLEEMQKTNNNIEQLLKELITKQGKIENLTRCVKKAHRDAQDVFDDDFKIILGETLYKAGIAKFPQKLNQAFIKYGKKFDFIKDCLIFPEDLK